MLVETQYFTCFEAPHELILESGKSLGSITIAYETYGQLNAAKSNAVLVCHALSGDAHSAFQAKDNPDHLGWWNTFIGPGKAIDTDKYFVLTTNCIGSCYGSTGPTSTNPKTSKPYQTDFPIITVTDMVKAQKALVDHLGIERLHGVIGGSMGGMQAVQWAISFPNRVASCIPIAAAAQLAPQALAFNAVGRYAIMSDPAWNDGRYDEKIKPDVGLSLARMVGHITYLSNESISLKFGRKLQMKEEYGYQFATDFQIESYLKYQGDKFVARFDANTYLYLSKAMSYFDLVKHYGSLKNAFAKVQAKFLIVSISSDWLYPTQQSKDIVKTLMNLNKEVTYCEVESPYGHDAFLMENEKLSALVKYFLENVLR